MSDEVETPTLEQDLATLRDALGHTMWPDEPLFGFQKVSESFAALMRLAIAAGLYIGPDHAGPES